VTVDDLREILNAPDLPGDLPVRVHITLDGRLVTPKWSSTFEWEPDGAHGQLAGPERRFVLELRQEQLPE
jgi:hypothetical protein